MLQLRSVKVVTYLTGPLSNSKDASKTRRSPPKPQSDSSRRKPTCKTPWSPLWWQGCSRWWDRSHGRSPWPLPCPYRLPPCAQETQASSPSCVSPCKPGESTAGRRSAAVERADTVQAHHLSAVKWTVNSMGSLMMGCGEAWLQWNHMPGRISANCAVFQPKTALFCHSRKVKAVNSTPPVCILMHPSYDTHCRLTLLIHGCTRSLYLFQIGFKSQPQRMNELRGAWIIGLYFFTPSSKLEKHLDSTRFFPPQLKWNIVLCSEERSRLHFCLTLPQIIDKQ